MCRHKLEKTAAVRSVGWCWYDVLVLFCMKAPKLWYSQGFDRSPVNPCCVLHPVAWVSSLLQYCCTSAPSPSPGQCYLPVSSNTEGTRKLGHEPCSAATPPVLWNKTEGTLERRQGCAKIRASVLVYLWSFFYGWCKVIWRTWCKSSVFPSSEWILIN